MTKPPAFQFYAKDWLTGTLELTLAARGAYITLMAYQWDKGSIPADDKPAMKRVLSCSTRELQTVWKTVKVHFTRGDDGLWRNSRLEKVRIEQDTHRTERSSAGVSGAKKRWSMAEPLAEPLAKAIATPIAKNSSSSSTPSSSSVRTLGTGGVVSSTSVATSDSHPPPLAGSRLCPTTMKHAWCDGRMHVPIFIHRMFQRTAPPDFNLMRWYAATDLAWSDQTVGDDEPTFWRARWLDEHGTTQLTDAQIKRAAKARGPTYHERPAQPDVPPMTADQRAAIEDRLPGEGWHKREDGQWRKKM